MGATAITEPGIPCLQVFLEPSGLIAALPLHHYLLEGALLWRLRLGKWRLTVACASRFVCSYAFAIWATVRDQSDSRLLRPAITLILELLLRVRKVLLMSHPSNKVNWR